jgi:hypothetical protein
MSNYLYYLFDTRPAFGLEFPINHAISKELAKKGKDLTQVYITNGTSDKKTAINRLHSEVKKEIILRNAVKILYYLPIIGMGLGILSICTASNLLQRGEYKSSIHHIIRGSIAFTNLGFLLIIPDLIETIHYYRQ